MDASNLQYESEVEDFPTTQPVLYNDFGIVAVDQGPTNYYFKDQATYNLFQADQPIVIRNARKRVKSRSKCRSKSRSVSRKKKSSTSTAHAKKVYKEKGYQPRVEYKHEQNLPAQEWNSSTVPAHKFLDPSLKWNIITYPSKTEERQYEGTIRKGPNTAQPQTGVEIRKVRQIDYDDFENFLQAEKDRLVSPKGFASSPTSQLKREEAWNRFQKGKSTTYKKDPPDVALGKNLEEFMEIKKVTGMQLNPYFERKLRDMIQEKKNQKPSFSFRYMDPDKVYKSEKEQKVQEAVRQRSKEKFKHVKTRTDARLDREKTVKTLQEKSENIPEKPKKPAIFEIYEPKQADEIVFPSENQRENVIDDDQESEEADFAPESRARKVQHEQGGTLEVTFSPRNKQTKTQTQSFYKLGGTLSSALFSKYQEHMGKNLKLLEQRELETQIKLDETKDAFKREMKKRIIEPNTMGMSLEDRVNMIKQKVYPMLDAIRNSKKELLIKDESMHADPHKLQKMVKIYAEKLGDLIIDDLLYEMIPILQEYEEKEQNKRFSEAKNQALGECLHLLEDILVGQNNAQRSADVGGNLAYETGQKLWILEREGLQAKQELKDEAVNFKSQLSLAIVNSVHEGKYQYTKFREKHAYLQKKNENLYTLLGDKIIDLEIAKVAKEFEKIQTQFVDELCTKEF